ncbi:hypothetical protein [Sphingosinicella humi]|uniref:Uncharacterized protein n=1 Tax=Allosphingosinicella humi TaxID=2068657 RepID=A0A2U2J599_9SPHN|nr:hypothetical protein [Sphingosinicella humi]PWG03487.1 hypothetical protein DF286_11860 [Sphingosinicella humi]
MNVRQFEKFLTQYGASAASLDMITRKLRSMELLPVGGRGPNAPTIGPAEAAWILLVLAGSSIPTAADATASRIRSLKSVKKHADGSDWFLHHAIRDLLGHRDTLATVKEVRVCRTTSAATIIYEDGREDHFVGSILPFLNNPDLRGLDFRVDGVLSKHLLLHSAQAIAPTEEAKVSG